MLRNPLYKPHSKRFDAGESRTVQVVEPVVVADRKHESYVSIRFYSYFPGHTYSHPVFRGSCLLFISPVDRFGSSDYELISLISTTRAVSLIHFTSPLSFSLNIAYNTATPVFFHVLLPHAFVLRDPCFSFFVFCSLGSVHTMMYHHLTIIFRLYLRLVRC